MKVANVKLFIAVIPQLICTLVLAYVKSRFPHKEADLGL